MSKPPVAPGAAQALIEMRRARIAHIAGPRSQPDASESYLTPPGRLEFFRREAEELYWNELAWEQMTEEEAIQGGHLTELVFPGLLALVDGLLPGPAGPRPYPDAVEEILAFLGEQGAALTAELRAGADSQKVLWARAMTLRLIDLVLYRLYHVSPDDQDRIEAQLHD